MSYMSLLLIHLTWAAKGGSKYSPTHVTHTRVCQNMLGFIKPDSYALDAKLQQAKEAQLQDLM